MRIAIEADWFFDLGPSTGLESGKIVATGEPEAVAKSMRSRTASYLPAQLDKCFGDVG